MNIKISIPLIIPELFVTWIIYLIRGGDFFQTFFYVNLAVIAVLFLLFLVLAFTSSKKGSVLAVGGGLFFIYLALSFLLPWVISAIFKIDFFKTFLVVAVLLELVKIKKNESLD